jgi:WD40 repeat protein
VLPGKEFDFTSAVFSRDGRRVLTTNTASIGILVRDPRGAVGIRGDGRQVPKQLTAGSVWDAETGVELVTLNWPQHVRGGVGRGEFSSDGRRVLTFGRDSRPGSSTASGERAVPHVWDAASGKLLFVLRPAVPEAARDPQVLATFSPDGRRVASVQGGRIARVWNAATGEELLVLRGHEDEVISVAFSHDGQRLVTTARDQTARVWRAPVDATTGPMRQQWPLPDLAVVSPDSRHLATVSWRENRIVRLWDIATGKEHRRLQGHTRKVRCLAFSPDSRKVVTGSDDLTARIWDAATGKPLAVLACGPAGAPLQDLKGVHFTRFSPDGRHLLTVTQVEEKGEVQVWDAGSGKRLAVLPGARDHPIFSAVFSPDGRSVLTRPYLPPRGTGRFTFDDAVACLWETATGKKRLTLRDTAKGIQGGCSTASFSPDGRRVITATSNHFGPHVWDSTTGKRLPSVSGDRSNVRAAVFSPTGRLILAAHGATASLRDADTGKELHVLKGHLGLIHHASFSPDGRVVLTAAEDGTARLWDAASGGETATLSEPDYKVSFAAFSPDGRWVLAHLFNAGADRPAPAGWEWKVRLFPVDLLAAAVARQPRDLTTQARQQFEIGRRPDSRPGR